jgi:hypothetical protein
MAEFTCFNNTNNPEGSIPPPDYKIYICDWKGNYPSSFTGTWYCTTPADCPLYPSTPTPVTFTPFTKCSTTYVPPPPPSGGVAVPFSIIVTDPTVPSASDYHTQALAIAVTGIVPASPTGIPDSGCTCGAGTIFLGYTFPQYFAGMCGGFRIEITGVNF